MLIGLGAPCIGVCAIPWPVDVCAEIELYGDCVRIIARVSSLAHVFVGAIFAKLDGVTALFVHRCPEFWCRVPERINDLPSRLVDHLKDKTIRTVKGDFR